MIKVVVAGASGRMGKILLPAVPGEGRGKRIAILFVLLGAALGLLWVMLRRGMLRM